ncbi:MAG TPA: septal ring lytic transglycosylase RlpA family protein [Hyphomonadaceae bacterium]|nr:septal ring lytic transglycosylase RlpA family protein [Hyphomonadaceae bacterium]
MAGATDTRGVSSVTLMISALIAAVFVVGGAQTSQAQTPAPIIFAKAGSVSAPTRRVEFASAGAVDLRSGVTKVSFGPSLPTARVEPSNGLASVPVSEPAAYAEPYAGPPYQVEGRWYVPTYEPNYDEIGIASWYGPTFHGKASASGETFDENAMTAAHPTLPIPSLVRVTNLENGRSVVVRLNDRGPFVDDRIIDLSRAAGKALDMHAKGTARVRVQYVGPAPAEHNAAPNQQVEVRQVAPMLPVAAIPVKFSMPVMEIASEPLPDLVPVQPAAVAAAPPSVRPIVQAARLDSFFVQAGSFSELGNAHAALARVNFAGPASVVQVDVKGATYYRVMVGPWASRGQAEQAQDRLVESGMRSFVVAKLGE